MEAGQRDGPSCALALDGFELSDEGGAAKLLAAELPDRRTRAQMWKVLRRGLLFGLVASQCAERLRYAKRGTTSRVP